MTQLGLDTWFDEPAYKAAKGSLSSKGAFILRKLMKHDGAEFVEIMADLYRDDAPDPQDITRYLRASWFVPLVATAGCAASGRSVRRASYSLGTLWILIRERPHFVLDPVIGPG
jgi:hypothetical protein